LLAPAGSELTAFAVAHAVLAATIGIFALAAGMAGYFRNSLSIIARITLFIAAALLLAPITKVGEYQVGLAVDVLGAAIFAVVAFVNCLYSSSGAARPATSIQ
jgi:TRAP-type uncharacterized transport system fused permease subunit